MQRKVILTVGGIASGKSTWAKEEVRKNPNFTRLNRDDLRVMMHDYQYTQGNEKLALEVRNFALKEALKRGRDVIIDDTNLNRRNFDDVCKIVEELGIDCVVMEKPFYVELEEAIRRDAARSGHGKVGEEVVKKFWKLSGGMQHRHYKPRTQVISANTHHFSYLEQDPSLPRAIICDLDGTLSLFNSIGKDGKPEYRHPTAHTRNPYDASNCDQDELNEVVANILKAFPDRQKIFVSGREDTYKEPTLRFLNKHLGLMQWLLFMRKAGDSRKDSIIKREIFDSHIRENFYVEFVLDDRASVVKTWRELGLICLQVAEGNF